MNKNIVLWCCNYSKIKLNKGGGWLFDFLFKMSNIPYEIELWIKKLLT